MPGIGGHVQMVSCGVCHGETLQQNKVSVGSLSKEYADVTTTQKGNGKESSITRRHP